jgi:hypothetical protein
VKITLPNEAEKQWIADHVARARALAAKYGGDESFRALDVVWSAFTESIREKNGDPNPVINLVGLAFGQRFVDELGFRWVVVTDEHGTEIAVHRTDNDVVIFPTATVAKRWASGEVAFVEQLFERMRADLP